MNDKERGNFGRLEGGILCGVIIRRTGSESKAKGRQKFPQNTFLIFPSVRWSGGGVARRALACGSMRNYNEPGGQMKIKIRNECKK